MGCTTSQPAEKERRKNKNRFSNIGTPSGTTRKKRKNKHRSQGDTDSGGADSVLSGEASQSAASLSWDNPLLKEQPREHGSSAQEPSPQEESPSKARRAKSESSFGSSGHCEQIQVPQATVEVPPWTKEQQQGETSKDTSTGGLSNSLLVAIAFDAQNGDKTRENVKREGESSERTAAVVEIPTSANNNDATKTPSLSTQATPATSSDTMSEVSRPSEDKTVPQTTVPETTVPETTVSETNFLLRGDDSNPNNAPSSSPEKNSTENDLNVLAIDTPGPRMDFGLSIQTSPGMPRKSSGTPSSPGVPPSPSSLVMVKPPVIPHIERDVKKGSTHAMHKEGVMGKVSTTGDAKTSSSLSSVQSGWFSMTPETLEDFIRMNAHIEALYQYEIAVAKANAMMMAAGNGMQQPSGAMPLPPAQGPTLAEMHITTYQADEGAEHSTLLECPNIELLLTFANSEQEQSWFLQGGLMRSMPHKNRRIVSQWFEEIGTVIKPVQVRGTAPLTPGLVPSGTGRGTSVSGISFVSGVHSQTSDLANNSLGLTMGSPMRAPGEEQKLTGKTLYLNDKLLKQMESRSTKRDKTRGSNRSSNRSVVSFSTNGSSHASSWNSETGSSVGGPSGGGGLPSDGGGSVADLAALEEERVHMESVDNRQRILEDGLVQCRQKPERSPRGRGLSRAKTRSSDHLFTL